MDGGICFCHVDHSFSLRQDTTTLVMSCPLLHFLVYRKHSENVVLIIPWCKRVWGQRGYMQSKYFIVTSPCPSSQSQQMQSWIVYPFISMFSLLSMATIQVLQPQMGAVVQSHCPCHWTRMFYWKCTWQEMSEMKRKLVLFTFLYICDEVLRLSRISIVNRCIG